MNVVQVSREKVRGSEDLSTHTNIIRVGNLSPSEDSNFFIIMSFILISGLHRCLQRVLFRVRTGNVLSCY